MGNTFISYLEQRGYIHQASNLEGLITHLNNEVVNGYIGFDCTADSLHVGSLVQIMILRQLQRFGHTPVILLGGGTTLIGDPSGKDEARKMLSFEDIQNNMNGIKRTLEHFIDCKNAIFLNNHEWLKDFNYINFLREYGPMFSINRMLTFDSIKLRLGRQQSLSFLEFNYMLLQAVDFAHMSKHYNVSLQMGGSDQWGNIVNGLELIRRKYNKEAFALTSPLITNSDGSKMGKTANGAVWLDANKTNTWDYFQFWRNTKDEDVERFFNLFTELPIEEIKQLMQSNINQAKEILAFNATKMAHSEDEAHKCLKIAHETFSNKGISESLPKHYITRQDLNNSLDITTLLTSCSFGSYSCQSKSEARRLINGGGVRINDAVIKDPQDLITEDMFDAENKYSKLSVGKKRHLILVLQD